MKEYIVKKIKDENDILSANKAMINIYNWGGEYRPNVYAYLGFVEEKGFMLRIIAEEKNPRAVHKAPDQDVYKDSCVEFFADFAPEKGKGYLNFEVNAKAALHLFLGKSIRERQSILKMGIKRPEGNAIRESEYWGYEIFIPLTFLNECYGEIDFKSGYKFKGSFYKCGDDTEFPHYASYTEIDIDHPSFHCPEFFADFIIE